ncbi:MAG TPA: prepilin-type N-terminal cleavage/methylation domain-containing protein [Armatimonadetes bacterium]|nr:prepilin-type N-terminal cleavage/methylation domain-containing protein [Armatimonadota bacterium]
MGVRPGFTLIELLVAYYLTTEQRKGFGNLKKTPLPGAVRKPFAA